MNKPLPFTHKMPLRPIEGRKITDRPWPDAYLRSIALDTGEIWICEKTYWVFLLRRSDWGIIKQMGCLNLEQAQAYACGLYDGLTGTRIAIL